MDKIGDMHLIAWEDIEDEIDRLQHRVMKKDEIIKKQQEIIELLQKENAKLKAKIEDDRKRYYAERDIDEEFE